ncbi:MAG: ATP-binding protein [Labilithrix sp.]|nr:ATP-binding protein [Labilithrix sp.]MCW5814213.1 ATP-binding protein [Labilithrix sp.]
MDPTLNPFAPGAGAPPPELAGRDEVLASASLALQRAKAGRAAKSLMLLGLRGVGKTVLLNQIAEIAEAEALHALVLESPEHEPLADLLVPKLRALLLKLSRVEKTAHRARAALGVLRAFATAFKAKIGDVEFTVAPAVGVADTGSLEYDLPDLFFAVAETMREVDSVLVLCIDEVQYLGKTDLSALIVAIHKLAQKSMPFLFFGAGLPQVATLAGEAKSYAERLFDYPKIEALDPAGARDAIVKPLEREGVGISDHAVQRIVEETHAFPYFLQEWGFHVWNETETPPVNVTDVQRATVRARAALDESFFHVRFARLTERERDYARAMASLGPGPQRSGAIADVLGVPVTSAASLRNELIKKGMVFSPQHGETQFTVPMFDDFLRRAMPEWKPPKPARPPLTRKRTPKGRA